MSLWPSSVPQSRHLRVHKDKQVSRRVWQAMLIHHLQFHLQPPQLPRKSRLALRRSGAHTKSLKMNSLSVSDLVQHPYLLSTSLPPVCSYLIHRQITNEYSSLDLYFPRLYPIILQSFSQWREFVERIRELFSPKNLSISLNRNRIIFFVFFEMLKIPSTRISFVGTVLPCGARPRHLTLSTYLA